MNSFNTIGRLVADPELTQTQGGKSCVKFRLAIDRGFKDANGQRQADFANFVAWDKTAEFICSYFRKGQMIGITSQFRNNHWTDQQGNKRYDYYFAVQNTFFCGDRGQETSGSYAGGYMPPQTPTGYNSPTSGSYNGYNGAPTNYEPVTDDDLPF